MNLITEKEICKRLGLSRTTILTLRKKGLPYYKIGGSLRFDFNEVLTWIKNK